MRLDTEGDLLMNAFGPIFVRNGLAGTAGGCGGWIVMAAPNIGIISGHAATARVHG